MHRTPFLRIIPAIALAAFVSVSGAITARGQTSAVWLGEADYPSFHINGDESEKASLSIVTLETPAGKQQGFRFTIRERAADAIKLTAWAPSPRPVAAKATLSAHFFMRTISSDSDSGEGKVQFIVENVKSYDKAIQFSATAASEWKEFNLPFTSKEDFAPGAASVFFRIGYLRQTVEIAGFEIKNYGPAVPVTSLPMTKANLNYAGMEPNAPWRKAADERIEKIRKSQLTIHVVDAAGQPVAGAQVEVQQTRHAFQLGTAISAKALLEDAKLSDAVLQNFNLVTFENDLKWPRWDRDRELPLQAARWCKEHGLALRGHNMIWPAWRYFPDRIKALQSKPDELRQEVLHHVEDVGAALAPYAAIWDVINEPFTNHDLMDVLGGGILKESFIAAKKSAPEARLFINDYGIVTSDGTNKAHQDSYERTIRELLDQQAPVEGIGIQGHFGQEFTPPERIMTILDRFAQFHLPLQMTEFTAQADDREMDANLLRDVMTVFFSHPAVDAFIFWGFYDGKGFDHKATLYDAKGDITPAGKIYRELVFHRWWTHETPKTNSDGTAVVQGFHGRYDVSVTRDGASSKQSVELKPGGATLKLVLGK